MNLLYPHRKWLALLIAALFLMTASSPGLRLLRAEATQHLADMRAAQGKTRQALHQLQDDIESVKKLEGQMDPAEAEKFLAPVDRMAAANALQQNAANMRLSHFTYNLSPEQKIKIDAPEAGPQELSLSTLTLSGDAPLDTDIYAFIDGLHHLLPGRVRLQQLSLERTDKADPHLTARNMHFEATLEWLSNHSKTMDIAVKEP